MRQAVSPMFSQVLTAHRWRRLRPWHPYYWGAFILQGAARDPASPRRSRGTPCHQSRHAGRWVPLYELLRGGKRGFHLVYQLEAGVSPGARLACCSCSMSSHIFANMNCLKSLAPFSPYYGEAWWARLTQQRAGVHTPATLGAFSVQTCRHCTPA